MQRLRVLIIVPLLALAACSSSSSSKSESPDASAKTTAGATTSTAAARPLRVLVTNDDGVTADGIDELVKQLEQVPNITITVVAPLTNQSSTGGKTTRGALTATAAKTKSGHSAMAVKGFPADTIVWAIDGKGVPQRPDVVMSGVNFGQNIGKYVKISGTVGAARAAAARGIPAIAASAGLAESPNYDDAAQVAIRWLTEHRDEYLASPSAGTASVTNINAPTCPVGLPKKVVVVPVAPDSADAFAPVDCVTPSPEPTTDVDGFVHGYIVQTNNLPPDA